MIVSRKPNFRAVFANREEFDSRLGDQAAICHVMREHLAEKAPHANQIASMLNDAISDGVIPLSHFSSRALSHQLLVSKGYKIVDGAKGRISNILITPPNKKLSPLHVRHYKSLISGLGGNRIYTIVCHPDNVPEIESWFAEFPKVELRIVLSPQFRYSIWAQDAYVAAKSANGQDTLIEGVCFPRAEDMTIADDIALQTDTAVLQSSLYFQGGNILGGEDTTLIGMDYVWRNTTRWNMLDEASVVAEMEKTFGTKMLPLGGRHSATYDLLERGVLSGYGQQPLFHIDMYVTPTGTIGSSGKEIVMLGRPSATRDVLGFYSETKEDGPLLDSLFDETADQLSRFYEVKNLPLCVTYGDLNGRASSSDYYWLTFNNVVIENAPEGKRVIMTTYSQDADVYGVDGKLRQALEEAAAQAWRDVGFDVHLMDGLEDLCYGQGSIHCITKDIARTQSETS